MKFRVVTLFPNYFKTPLEEGVVGQYFSEGQATLALANPRDFAEDNHHSVDDRPFGGGDGMVMMIDPLTKALKSFGDKNGPVVLLSPQGRPWSDELARIWSKEYGEITLICGRYAGLDQRFINRYVDQEVSVGDYILSGGELAALVVIDSLVRHLPGALGNPASSEHDTFRSGLLEGPLFTRPNHHDLGDVPEFLLSGNHQKIAEIRNAISLCLTRLRRPDLLGEKMTMLRWPDLAQSVLQLSEPEKNALGFTPIELVEMKKWK